MQAVLTSPLETKRTAGILVVDDHDLVRLGLRTLVQLHGIDSSHRTEVFEAKSLRDALATYGENPGRISLVLLDLHLPDAHGLSGLTVFKKNFPASRVVVLSAVSDPVLVRQAIACGASAYLAKSGDLQHVVRFIRAMGLLGASEVLHDVNPAQYASNHQVPHPKIARIVCTPAGDRTPLTARQAEVLDWVLAGRSNRQISEMAQLSEGTVKNHVSTLLLLFNVRSRSQLISQLR